MKWGLLSMGLSEVSREFGYHSAPGWWKPFVALFYENSDFTARAGLRDSDAQTASESRELSQSVWLLLRWVYDDIWGLYGVNHSPFLTAEVRRSLLWRRRRGASWLCWSGSPSKANFSACHSQQFYHTLHALMGLWKLNLCLQIDEVRGINCDCLQ